ncbi:hypothetical protein SDC9_120946 [bioreactor metagenome]|uniref:Uncharacterized protein n=1 Tax=bioreactor metagenome TaxID=1076179 RepID=A0A645CAK1_9ZZZZ
MAVSGKNVFCTQGGFRLEENKPGLLLKINLLYLFSNTADNRRAGFKAIGHISSDLKADLLQLMKRVIQSPQPVEACQNGGGIRAAAA